MIAVPGRPRSGKLSSSLVLCLFLGSGVLAAEQSDPMDSFYRNLGGVEKSLAKESFQNTLETAVSHKTGRWRDATTGNSGTLTPLRTFRIKAGNYCREYRENLYTDQWRASRTGIACRIGTGIWVRAKK